MEHDADWELGIGCMACFLGIRWIGDGEMNLQDKRGRIGGQWKSLYLLRLFLHSLTQFCRPAKEISVELSFYLPQVISLTVSF